MQWIEAKLEFSRGSGSTATHFLMIHLQEHSSTTRFLDTRFGLARLFKQLLDQTRSLQFIELVDALTKPVLRQLIDFKFVEFVFVGDLEDETPLFSLVENGRRTISCVLVISDLALIFLNGSSAIFRRGITNFAPNHVLLLLGVRRPTSATVIATVLPLGTKHSKATVKVSFIL